jgi:hypothetical protein
MAPAPTASTPGDPPPIEIKDWINEVASEELSDSDSEQNKTKPTKAKPYKKRTPDTKAPNGKATHESGGKDDSKASSKNGDDSTVLDDAPHALPPRAKPLTTDMAVAIRYALPPPR